MAKGNEYKFKCRLCQKDLIQLVVRSDTLNKQKIKVICSCGDGDEKAVVGDFAWLPMDARVIDVTQLDNYVEILTA